LNRHCAECEFQARCRKIAIEKDDLSLLARMTEQERKKLRSKGIFTVTQLSYTFRPRRRPKKQRDKREKYHHSLKALAIREKKIHIVGTPELKIEGTPVYLDVEGLPDRDFYYLIGLRIGNGDSGVQRSLWADTVADEGKIWGEFLAILETVEKPVLIHYGSYETTFISNMRNRHGSPPENSVPALAIGAAFNLVSFMFGRIYFPTFSNRLKELASMLGARWSSAASSGLQSLLWRHEWETSGGQGMRDRLIEYNQEDCTALLLLVNELGSVIAGSQTRQDVDFADAPKSPMTNRATEIQRAFNAVRLSANSDPSKSRIRLTPDGSARLKPSRGKRSSRKSIKPKLPAVKGRIIRVATKRKCPAHPENPGLLISEKRLHTRSLADIAFTKTGPRKTVLRMVGRAGRCPICATKYFPPAFSRIKNHQYGSGFSVWVVYLRLVLRLPYRLIVQFTRDLFNVEMSTAKSEEFVRQCAADYASTEETLYEKLLQSPSIHVDETKLSILGSHQFVWVLTDGKHVIFRMTDSRETGFLQPLLAEYRGTLVSDFYGGYDAIPCQQQKCLVQRNR
jgi:transposase